MARRSTFCELVEVGSVVASCRRELCQLPADVTHLLAIVLSRRENAHFVSDG